MMTYLNKKSPNKDDAMFGENVERERVAQLNPVLWEELSYPQWKNCSTRRAISLG